MKTILLLVLLLATVFANIYEGNIWPIGKSDSLPDLIQTSPYGPRIKKSEERYDWHRGVDIPCTLGDPLYAIADGKVIKSGKHKAYRDPLVQVRHYFGGVKYYVNYLHAQDIVVQTGDIVKRGQQLCGCGASKSGFAHSHFEVRKGGLWQKHCINPWTVLPHTNTASESFHVELLSKQQQSNGNWNYDFYVTQPGNKLIFNGLKVEFKKDSFTNAQYVANFEEMTGSVSKYTPEVLDNPVQGNWKFEPYYFGTYYQDRARYKIYLNDIPKVAGTNNLRVHILTVDGVPAEIVDIAI